MRERTVKLRRARNLFAYWRDGRLFFHNFARRLTVSARPVTCEVLGFFDNWRTPQEATTHFSAYSEKSVLSAKGLRAGLYHYHPAHHCLKMISRKATREKAQLYCAHQDYVRNAAALFPMTAVFPRAMWKYRHARAYRVVSLDAGHLCQTFCLVATWLGLAPFCTAALKDTLIEKDLGIDGIRESILYVTGVGFPATSARVRRQFSRSVDRRAGDPSKDEA
ncbi:MAG: hypothetical protein DME33_05300 [Verrucomicrobia bacterium]|nr:MAG: hypothetical protein DME33_05300 [Verrucomicrobiota bacterium]